MLKQLADEAAVPYDAHYNVTILQYSDVIWDRPQRTMWQLIVQNGMPPTRTARYCCRELKERGGIGRIVALGIRWAESQQMIEVCHKTGRSLVNPIRTFGSLFGTAICHTVHCTMKVGSE